MLSPIPHALSSGNNTPTQIGTTSVEAPGPQTTTASGDSVSDSTSVQISAAAQQKAKQDAEAERLAAMSPKELQAEAKRLEDQITLVSDAAVAKANQEVPNTADPALLARARQATAFFQKTASNPFVGLPRDQLTAIMYDDSGAYTVNERRAASRERGDQDYTYWSKLNAQAQVSGDYSAYYQAASDAYDKMSPLEKAAGGYTPAYKTYVEVMLKQEKEKHSGSLLNLLASPNVSGSPSYINTSPILPGSTASNEPADPASTGASTPLATPSVVEINGTWQKMLAKLASPP